MKLFLICFLLTLVWAMISPVFERNPRDMNVTQAILYILIAATIASLIVPVFLAGG